MAKELEKIVDGSKWLFKSPYSVKETIDRLLKAIDKNPEVLQYDRIDQQAVSRIAGKEVRPAECVFFQNSELVGLLLSLNIRTAEVLPMQAVAYEDDEGQVWLVTNNPNYMDEHYNLNGGGGLIAQINVLFPGWIAQALDDN
ncbi:DUF302 domain-containing protein [Halomonas binhaiensis]|uniref:DUF302 domain-containing protein n=1 Tax=Halomonas binhaiensis TaxID=2562282 RepID=A0A5C1NH20_9GAMM|nr:DUF302 domain-containing protein [Halomonas binhaiensis]QEM82514.1 DUF302 domain-containing protein [Halomonas binhaiensis]